MKCKKYIKSLCYFIMFTLLIGFTIGASTVDIPNKIKVNTDKEELYEVRYDDFYMGVRRLNLGGLNQITYCLEIEKDYPSGQNFVLQGNNQLKKIDNIIAAGYPSKSPAELNLSNDNEAYFATQIAIWSSIEGYDINKITGDNQNIIGAIQNIYKEAMSGKTAKITENKVYKTDNEAVQNVVVVFDPNNLNLNLTEEQAELLQPEYPNQEG